MEEVLLVRYGEIGLKGLNRSEFESTLVDNIRGALEDMPGISITRPHGRIYVEGVQDPAAALDKLSRVPGIVSVARALKAENDMEQIRCAAVQAGSDSLGFMRSQGLPLTFKIDARRTFKEFPVTSPDLNRILGGAALSANPDLSVDVHSPSATIRVEVRETGTYVFWEELKGPGGLPVGSSGKGLLLISGGIDSPVAGYLAMKRGVALDALHFWSYPITGERSRDKVIDICKVLRNYCPSLRLYIAPFTETQTAIIENCPERFRVTVMRRMMMRVASALARQTGAGAIFTGENLGQVASQTQESLAAIEDAAEALVLRPLICFDKQETVTLARTIGTYDLSCLPYEDCCSVFVPKHPVTRPRTDEAKDAEKDLAVKDLVDACIRGITEAPL